MNRVLVVLSIIAAALVAVAQVQGGLPLVAAGFNNAFATLRQAALLVVLAFAVTGLMQVLVEPDTIRRWLGSQAGLRGVLLGAAAGALTPGGPYVYYPLALAIRRAGAGMGTILSYIAGKCLWDVMRIPLELAFFGTRLTAIRWSVTVFVPLLVGVAATRLMKEPAAAGSGGEAR